MHRNDLEVVALTPREWRVCDGTIDENDARRILGYIEHRADGFEVLALCPAPRFRSGCASWNEALGVLLAFANGAGRASSDWALVGSARMVA
jgi:hypothetical protein